MSLVMSAAPVCEQSAVEETANLSKGRLLKDNKVSPHVCCGSLLLGGCRMNNNIRKVLRDVEGEFQHH